MQFKGLELDQFQIDAIESIRKNNSLIVSAPTGSGKTLIADYIIDQDVGKGVNIIYTAPIKALSNQKYKEFTKSYGEKNVGLVTGDVVINSDAPVLIMTTEIYRNMAITKDPSLDKVSYLILDEVHFINDIERGHVWEESIIFSPDNVRFLCLSATIPNAKEFAQWIEKIKKHKVDVIVHEKRAVPLSHQFFDARLGIATLEKIKTDLEIEDNTRRFERRQKQKPERPDHVDLIRELHDDFPCFFFAFSRAICQKKAQELANVNPFGTKPEIIEKIREKFKQLPPEANKLESIQILKRTLPRGIGFHHAGLLPIAKEMVEEMFSQKLIQVLYTTETFAVGINMPAKTVIFEDLRKFDGITFRMLSTKEYFQIAGRAGRRGIDKQGKVISMIFRPTFDYDYLKQLTDKDTEPIRSRFQLGVNTVLNLVRDHNDEEIKTILSKSFFIFQQKKRQPEVKARYYSVIKTLRKLEYVYKTDDPLKEYSLTAKGEFASNLFQNEIVLSETFATDFAGGLNEYQMLLILAALEYEPKERDEFKEIYASEHLSDLFKRIKQSDVHRQEKKFNELKKMTSLIHPLFTGKSFFEIVDNTSMMEGDVIRFFLRLNDAINQLEKASDDSNLKSILDSCRNTVKKSLGEVSII